MSMNSCCTPPSTTCTSGWPTPTPSAGRRREQALDMRQIVADPAREFLLRVSMLREELV
ncbi:hypothetical protein [Streptosporangium sp. KLBMP 9127]|nr:hypothetical protein [Streptosporangium sp. KLBMP 9127]